MQSFDLVVLAVEDSLFILKLLGPMLSLYCRCAALALGLASIEPTVKALQIPCSLGFDDLDVDFTIFWNLLYSSVGKFRS